MDQLSPNFLLAEFTVSQTAARFNLDNTPSLDVVLHLKRLCDQILEPARAALGPLHISSGYRSPLVNSRVGGSKTSAHVSGWAADVIPLRATKMELAKWVVENVDFDQVILEFGTLKEPSWIHLSAEPRNRKQVLRILADGQGYRPITL